MHLPLFDYHAPCTLEEALVFLQQEGERSLPLAGGTDLLVMMKEGKLKPKSLLSLKNLIELRGVNMHNGNCMIGAATTISELTRSPLTEQNPAFADLAQHMATRQIRNRATVGGNLCTAAACADCPPVLLVNDAVVTLVGDGGEREIPLAQFITGPRATQKRAGELLHSITCQRENPGSAYVKFGVRRAATIAIVGVAAAIETSGKQITRLKLAATAASPVPVVLDETTCGIAGGIAGEEAWAMASQRLLAILQPIADLRGSVDYRFHLAQVGAQRALRLAYARWQGVANA